MAKNKIRFAVVEVEGSHASIFSQLNDALGKVFSDDLKRAYERSGLDISLCMKCGQDVVCVPDGLPMCEACSEEES